MDGECGDGTDDAEPEAPAPSHRLKERCSFQLLRSLECCRREAWVKSRPSVSLLRRLCHALCLAAAAAVEGLLQILPRVARRVGGDFLRRADGDQMAAGVAALGA